MGKNVKNKKEDNLKSTEDTMPVSVSSSMQREEKETAQALYKSDPNVCELSKKEHQKSNNNNMDWGTVKINGPSLWDAIQTVEL